MFCHKIAPLTTPLPLNRVINQDRSFYVKMSMLSQNHSFHQKNRLQPVWWSKAGLCGCLEEFLSRQN